MEGAARFAKGEARQVSLGESWSEWARRCRQVPERSVAAEQSEVGNGRLAAEWVARHGAVGREAHRATASQL